MPKVKILNRHEVIDCPGSTTILDAALDAGIDYPFGCHSGACGACKTRLITGEVDLADYTELALSNEERQSGAILACRATPKTDCVVLFDEDSEAPRHPLRSVKTRVVAVERATHDILIVRLGVAAGEAPLAFTAGQFANLTFPGAPSRDYSMANRPGNELIEFHIRHVPNGTVSSLVHRSDIVGQTVTLRGPYGVSYLRHEHKAPILAVAGGSGLAPIASIVETALQLGMQQRIAIYFGARTERDLYMVDRFEALAREHANVTYVPVLSNEDAGATTRRTGFVSDAVRADHGDLKGWKIYSAGPPPMVDAVMAVAKSLGANGADCHADPFYTAADRVVAKDHG